MISYSGPPSTSHIALNEFLYILLSYNVIEWNYVIGKVYGILASTIILRAFLIKMGLWISKMNLRMSNSVIPNYYVIFKRDS